MSYVVGYGKDKFVQGDVESICKADPQVYFAASVLWQLVASWVNDLREANSGAAFTLAPRQRRLGGADLPIHVLWQH
jgi:hypothetical protein